MRSIKMFAALLLVAALLSPSLVLAKQDGWPDELVFGVIPTESSSNANERFTNLVQYLEKRLGVPIQFKTSTDYAGVITGMQFKHVDFAYFGPKSYCEASKRADAEAFAIEVGQDGTNGYHGVIITNKQSGLNTLSDIKGKTWAFTDPNSTSGTLVPTVFFTKDLKINPEKYFSKVIYSGSHEASMLAVKGNKIDAASTNDLDMDRGDGKHWNKDQDFNILWTSKLIPGSPMAYRKDLPESLKKALKDAFLAYDDKAGLEQLKLSKYADVADSDYDPIRELIEVKKQLAKK
ncbi:MAG: phosphonate ABC transporter substrate-binding protein [Desulfuromonadales bacterium]|nr:phosphonate ABC transporter substrate-binding protein [Desulfuromonadales bacterium]